jgi:hypothetical protein
MPRVGFQPKIPEFERAKIFHALDCAATVIGSKRLYQMVYTVACMYLYNCRSTVFMHIRCKMPDSQISILPYKIAS